MEFFDSLSKEERAQVWAMTFALDDGKTATARPTCQRGAARPGLNERLVERLQQERDPARRDLIYGFRPVRRAEGLPAKLPRRRVQAQCLRRARAAARRVFTSGTQEGSPIDRLIGAMAQSMNLDRQHLARRPAAGAVTSSKTLHRRGLCRARAWSG
jgi:type VI secretion system protein ImpL